MLNRDRAGCGRETAQRKRCPHDKLSPVAEKEPTRKVGRCEAGGRTKLVAMNLRERFEWLLRMMLLVFILSIGYYITPALLGGPADQMMSYFIADHLSRSLNWVLASALGGLLLAGVLVLYALYERLVGVTNVRLG